MSSGSQTRVAAFFDIDGTLVPPPSLEWRFFRRMIYQRAIPAKNYWLWLREAIRLVPDGVFALHHNNKMCLRGTKSGVGARDFGPANNSSHLVAFFPAGVARVAWHAARGHAIALVSGTLEPLAQHTALLLEAQLRARGCETTVRVCATRMEESRGRFTGRILGEAMVGAEKARAARRIAAAEGWDLARSFAYGDDASDRWLLETVRHPAAINPTARLARIASGRRWPMLEWKAESRILRLGSDGPFEQSTYGKQRTYAVSNVNCVIRARITGTRRTYLLSGLVLFGALLLVAGVAPAQQQPRTFRISFHDVHGRIILDVKLDGKPAALLFDTGAAMSFRLEPPRPLILVVHNGEPHFETTAPDERCPAMAVPEVRVQGFVGTDVLKRFRAVRIDFKNHVVELESK